MITARSAAFDALCRWEKSLAFADSIAERDIRGKLDGADADLAREIFYGSIRWKARLDFIIDHSSFKIRESGLRSLLQTGLYQLLFLDRVPDYAAVNETVALAPPRHKGLVNAFLRAFLRERADWNARINSCRESKPEIFYSHPVWLIRKWDRAFGTPRTARLLEWNNGIPPVFVRANTLKAPVDRLQSALADHQLKATPHPLVFEVGSPHGLFSTEAFVQGWFYVQDPGTLKAVDCLDPQPGETVLDPCAAPGGKTTYIAQKMGDKGAVVASDIDPDRLRTLEENKTRLGCRSIRLVRMSELMKSSDAYDRILLDVPCSNTGVIRRRVDLRWKIRREEILSLADEQLQLGVRFAGKLRPGGVLVYSTCSLEREENEQIIERLCKKAPPLRLEQSWTSFPPESGMDGAYVARLIKGEKS